MVVVQKSIQGFAVAFDAVGPEIMAQGVTRCFELFFDKG
jgi:hypothetical protein